jgi:hypothetical protein
VTISLKLCETVVLGDEVAENEAEDDVDEGDLSL